MRESSKAALGGIVAALSIVVMLITYISPLLVYTAPPFAGILLIVVIEEINSRAAFATFCVISVLSVFFIADKESAVFYVVFFGYYPILRKYLSGKLKKKPLQYIAKIIVFNIALLTSVSVCAFVFSIDYSDFSEYGNWFLVLFCIMMNVVFVCYDFLLDRLMLLYNRKLKKRIRKILRH